MFTKLIKEISIAAKLGGGDQANPRLRTVILKAKAANMPKDNIDRAIKKGTGELEGVSYEEILYEAYGPGGVAILIDILTDNKNRAAAEIRNLLNKGGGNLGTTGSVAYLFKRKGLINYDAAKYKEDDILAVAIDAGAEDVYSDEDSIEVTTSPEDFEKVIKALEAKGFAHSIAEIVRVADTTVTLDNDKTQKALKLVEHLEDHEDVQSVATNLEIPDGFVMRNEDADRDRSRPGLHGLGRRPLRRLPLPPRGPRGDRDRFADSLPSRLLLIHEGIRKILTKFSPDEAGVEELFFSKNITSAIPVAHARGVVVLALGQNGIPVGFYTPQQVKQAVIGKGRAEKDQVQRLVAVLLGLETVPAPDHAADALAVAVCHARGRPPCSTACPVR